MATTAVLGFASEYQVTPTPETYFKLEVHKTGLLSGKKHVFVFPSYSGHVTYDPSDPMRSAVQVEIETTMLKCVDTWVSAKDLRKIQQLAERDMLAIDRFPKMIFQSTRITAAGANKFEASGDLTIRDITRPAVVVVTLQPGTEGSYLAEGFALVKLTDYKLKPPSAALGLIGTKNEMDVRFRLTLFPLQAGSH